ncbi:hypothetical protein MBLNU13_g09626t1 [Cladosporium sp. NU13]
MCRKRCAIPSQLGEVAQNSHAYIGRALEICARCIKGSNDSHITSRTSSVCHRPKFAAVLVHTGIVTDQEGHGCKIPMYRGKAERGAELFAGSVDIYTGPDDSAYRFKRSGEDRMV